MLSRDQLQRGAADGGFQVESYEKVCVLIDLLGAIRAHPFLGHRMVLKGGTALNLFVLDFPRLSVDIDLNYIGASDRATMLNERPRIEQALEQVFGRLRLVVKRAPNEHAGGKWRLTNTSALGRPGTLEVDVNFMLRTPLWPAAPRDSHSVGGLTARQILFSMNMNWPPGSSRHSSRAARVVTSSMPACSFDTPPLIPKNCGLASLFTAVQTERTGDLSPSIASPLQPLMSMHSLYPCCAKMCALKSTRLTFGPTRSFKKRTSSCRFCCR